MRSWLVLVILGWVLGVGLGVFDVSYFWIIVVGGLLLAAGWQVFRWWSFMLPILLAVGVVWGMFFGELEVVACDVTKTEAEGHIGAVEILEESQRFLLEEADGCLTLVTVGRWIEIREGDVVRLTSGKREGIDAVRDFSEGYADYLVGRGVGGTWRWAGVEIIDQNRDEVGFKLMLREQVGRTFVEPDASVVMALLFGERGTLPDDLQEGLRVAGVSHVLAISGLHISLLAALMWGVLLLLPLSPWTRSVVGIGLLWVYVWFLDWPVSAVRAGVFWSLFLIGLRGHMLVSLPTVLLLTVLGLVTADPLYWSDVGFQLSLSAVGGIFLMLFVTRDLFHKGWTRTVATAIIVSSGATMMTWPLVAWHFGVISLAGVVVNLVVVPVVPLLVVSALLGLILSAVWLPLGLVAGYVFHLGLRWVRLVVEIVEQLPYVFWEDVMASGWLIVVYYLALFVLLLGWLRWRGRSWREIWG